MRDLIYREVLEYHPQMLADFLAGGHRQPNFVYPSAVDNFKRQFAHLEAGGRGQANPHLGQATSLPRERMSEFRSEAQKYLAGRPGAMSGVSGATAYTSHPYSTSVDMDDHGKAVELVRMPVSYGLARWLLMLMGGVAGGQQLGGQCMSLLLSGGPGVRATCQPLLGCHLPVCPPLDLQLGSSVERMSVMDAASGFPTNASGYLQQGPPPTQYPMQQQQPAGYGVPGQAANKHLATAYQQQQQQQQQNLLRSNSAV